VKGEVFWEGNTMAVMENQSRKFISRSFIGAFGTSLFTAFFIYILEIIFVVAFTALIY
jgi:hypothetical protein